MKRARLAAGQRWAARRPLEYFMRDYVDHLKHHLRQAQADGRLRR